MKHSFACSLTVPWEYLKHFEDFNPKGLWPEHAEIHFLPWEKMPCMIDSQGRLTGNALAAGRMIDLLIEEDDPLLEEL